MARINGIRCDWCGTRADLVGDRTLPALKKSEDPWSTIHHLACAREEDLCGSCTQAADSALNEAKTRCKERKGTM